MKHVYRYYLSVVFYRRGSCRYHFFFFNDTATTEIYTLSLHDALPISTDSTPPIRMPMSTETLARKPLAKRAISRMDSSTMAEMPTPVRSPYLGLGMVGTTAKPLGTGGSEEPGAPAVAWASASHFRCSGLGTDR